MFKNSSDCKINNQTILKEHIDEHYQPTEDEIREYALYIGIDLDKEQELLWLAKEGLMKPLPTGWKACQNENGELYYFNFDTGKSSWDHPYDEIYKARVIQEREKRSSLILVLDTHSKGKNTLSISDLSSEKNVYNVPISGKNETADHQCDSQYTNSESDEELINSEAHSTSDFQKDLDFGIDRQLSARIERGEMDPSKMILSVEEKVESNERVKHASLAAEAAERRLSLSKPSNNENIPNEQGEISTLRTRLERAANDEKLELLEENRLSMEKFKVTLTSEKEREERTLRDQMKADLKLIENKLEEELNQETKLLQLRHKNDLSSLKQTLEREKQDLQTKLRSDMLADVKLDQENNTNIQIRLLQMKHEFDERLRNVENRYKSEIEDLTRRYEQIKSDKELFEKRFHEKNELCLNLQRMIDQLRAEKSGQFHEDIFTSKIIDDENSNLTEDKTTFHPIDENDDGLSDTDSDVIEMKQTLNQLKSLNDFNTPSNSIEFSKGNSFHPFRRTISYERPASNQSLMDTGRWSQTMLSTINKTYPLSQQQQSSVGKTNFWQSQPSLITREAVLKAARDVLPPGVIDHLTSKH